MLRSIEDLDSSDGASFPLISGKAFFNSVVENGSDEFEGALGVESFDNESTALLSNLSDCK